MAALLIGCAGPRPTAPPPLSLTPQDALRAAASATVRGPVAVTARIEVRRFGERLVGRAALMLQSPGRLRFESLPPLGPPDFFLSVDEGLLSVFDPAKSAFYRGRATAGNLSRFLPLAAPPEDLVALLLGRPPAGKGPVEGRWEGPLYRVDREGEAERFDAFWIDPVEGRLVRWERFGEDGRVTLSAAFAEPASVGPGEAVPQQLTFKAEGMTLAVRYTEILPVRPEEATFALPLPEGMTPESLD